MLGWLVLTDVSWLVMAVYVLPVLADAGGQYCNNGLIWIIHHQAYLFSLIFPSSSYSQLTVQIYFAKSEKYFK